MPVDKPNVYLVGPMGSGKTTIGKRVASKLGLEFLDCDSILESRTGASVNLIFDVEGEEGFRERESALLRELSARRGCLIATGGGCILRPENRALMKRTGMVVYLRTSVAQQLKRLRLDKSRPLLQAPDRRERLEAMAEKRNPLYEEVADIVFPSQRRSIALAVERLSGTILSYFESGSSSPRYRSPRRRVPGNDWFRTDRAR